jgi:hypothetical protein
MSRYSSATVTPAWTLTSRAISGMSEVFAIRTVRSSSERPVRGSSSVEISASTAASSLPRSQQLT